MQFGGLQLDSLLHWPKGSGGRNTGREECLLWSPSDPRSVVKWTCWVRIELQSANKLAFCTAVSFTIGIAAQLCENICFTSCLETTDKLWLQEILCLLESWLNTSCSAPGVETIWGHDVKKKTVKKGINAEGGASDWGKLCTRRDAQCRPIGVSKTLAN